MARLKGELVLVGKACPVAGLAIGSLVAAWVTVAASQLSLGNESYPRELHDGVAHRAVLVGPKNDRCLHRVGEGRLERVNLVTVHKPGETVVAVLDRVVVEIVAVVEPELHRLLEVAATVAVRLARDLEAR